MDSITLAMNRSGEIDHNLPSVEYRLKPRKGYLFKPKV